MNFKAQHIPYSQTHAFSKIVLDYIGSAPELQPFYSQPPTMAGLQQALSERTSFPYNRKVLVEQLKKQYQSVPASEKVTANIEALLSQHTFTVCTAHQPNIFTGHLYFIYKVLHAVKVASELSQQMTGYNFVPVYYMGSEDADLDELGEVHINETTYQWKTRQTGAVGRMKIDKDFIKIIDSIEGQLGVTRSGIEIMTAVRNAYSLDKTIEQATFEFVNELFGSFGLVILLPDNAVLKNEFSEIVKKELLEQFSAKAVRQTIATFPQAYKVQARGRQINLFYLNADSRERMAPADQGWKVLNTQEHFTREALLKVLADHPERFSPNVILRPVFQEMMLPNIAFIGGGGELAYWLELKKVFEAVNVPYPVLILRNSFLLVNKSNSDRMRKLSFTAADFFEEESQLLDALVRRETSLQLSLEAEKNALMLLYGKMKQAAAAADATLQNHVAALQRQATKKIEQLEKKMLKAERLRAEAQQRQIRKIKEGLFPQNNLQERIDNILPYYSTYGRDILESLYANSAGLQQVFTVLTEC